jgi:hypothetical protein
MCGNLAELREGPQAVDDGNADYQLFDLLKDREDL